MKPKRTTSLALLLSVIFCACLFILSASAAFAIIGINEPIIPCGTEIVNIAGKTVIQNPCTFCHIFALVHNIYNFLMLVIVPPVAVLLVAVAGFYWLISGMYGPGAGKGRSILLSVLIGLLMMYVAWLLINFGILLVARNVGAYNPAVWYDPSSWFKLSCSTSGAGGEIHNECRNGNCVPIQGAGTSQCIANSDCNI